MATKKALVPKFGGWLWILNTNLALPITLIKDNLLNNDCRR